MSALALLAGLALGWWLRSTPFGNLASEAVEAIVAGFHVKSSAPRLLGGPSVLFGLAPKAWACILGALALVALAGFFATQLLDAGSARSERKSAPIIAAQQGELRGRAVDSATKTETIKIIEKHFQTVRVIERQVEDTSKRIQDSKDEETAILSWDSGVRLVRGAPARETPIPSADDHAAPDSAGTLRPA